MKSGPPLALMLAFSVVLTPNAVRAGQDDSPSYGSNPNAGNYANVNGIKLYYETYGRGPVMLQIHGNGLNIASLSDQIRFFSSHYKVIAADSRGHGKSELGSGRLTYEQMAEDLNSLLDQLKIKEVFILGWSDGGILGLLLAIHHPEKVVKLAIMGANLEPSGAYDWAQKWVAKQDRQADEMIAKGDKSQDWNVQKQHFDLLGKQPHITTNELQKISAPTLVMAGDKDVIRTDHTALIFENLPKAHLCIFPGSTHMIPQQNPALFNKAVETFFGQPYARPDTKEFLQ
jgi:pimeloyl-ACP methyl ester carboxylesterase